MSGLSKQERKQRLRQVREHEREAERVATPISQAQLQALLDHLNASLDACDNTLSMTRSFLASLGIAAEVVVPWLEAHGAFCDCEVLNLEDLLEAPPARRPIARPSEARLKEPTPSRDNPAGWNPASLPVPWRVSNAARAGEELWLQLGKKDVCALTLIASSLPAGDRRSDEYWVELWRQQTQLSGPASFVVEHAHLRLPPGLNSVCVWTQDYVPVYCWIFADGERWHAVVRTELQRRSGDLEAVSQLVRYLEKTEG